MKVKGRYHCVNCGEFLIEQETIITDAAAKRMKATEGACVDWFTEVKNHICKPSKTKKKKKNPNPGLEKST